MKKRILSILTALCLPATMLPMTALAAEISEDSVLPGIDVSGSNKTWGSDYETATEFAISTEAELRAFAAMANTGEDFAGKTVKLSEDIALIEEQWIPIAAKANTFFGGTFDRQGNTISGLILTLEAPTADVVFPGLFSKVSGTIQEESLNYDIDGIAGRATVEAEVSDCINNGEVTAEHSNSVGGIVGNNNAVLIPDTEMYGI